MIAILGRQTLLTIFSLAGAAAAAGCTPPPAAVAPAAAASVAPAPAASAKAPPLTGPRIVGAVSTNTGDPPKTGGVVFLEDAPKQPGVAMTATIDVHNKDFTPLISVITTGGTVTFGNLDPLTHHVFSPDIDKWDTGYLRKNETAGRTFDAPAAIPLLCNIHPEMIGYLLVIPSTYFGKFGSDGKYVIGNVPPGTYKATVWAPRMERVTKTVTVGEGAVVTNFELRPAVGAK